MNSRPRRDPRQSSAKSYTSREMRQGWENAYASKTLTNWEISAPCGLMEVLGQLRGKLGPNPALLEIGCGRALKTFIALLGNSFLNSENVKLTAIDLSQNAIATAGQIRSVLEDRRAEPSPFIDYIAQCINSRSGSNPDKIPHLRTEVTLVSADLFAYLPTLRSRVADVVVDWMCFHELSPASRRRYSSLIARLARKYFVLNVFSREGSSRASLGDAVPGVMKYQFSRDDIVRFFGQHFQVVEFMEYEEDNSPDPRPTDEFVAAKRAYLLERRDTSKD